MNQTAHGICKKCGKESVHLAMSGLIDFHGDQDDDLENESIYADGVMIPDDVRVGIHVCFECGHVEDAWLDEPHENETIKQLRAENARLAAELAEARMFLLKIHTDIYGDDYGDLMCEFDDDFLKEIEQFLGKTAVKDGE